ncbi:MAG TPA: hypothetical protein G4N95_03585 [Anaerolineae bacterium]|nr:hypothetical protein [Anaerolineae bacterium]
MIFKVGDISISINCSNDILRRGILSQYNEFILETNENVSDFILEIDWEPSYHDRLQEEFVIKFIDNYITASNQFSSVRFDLKNNVGVLQINLRDPFYAIDYFLRICLSLIAFNHGGFLLHSAGIVRNDLAYLFFGPSGSGKTTIAKNSSNFKILNDDLILILNQNGKWKAYGTPFWNPTQETPRNDNAHVKGAFYIIKDDKVHLDTLYRSKALGLLIAGIPIINANKDYIYRTIALLEEFLNDIPAFELRLPKGAHFWEVIDDYFGKYD